jgi:DNA-binding transcriptional LysR family regulator
MFDLNTVALFVEVVRAGSFAGAARRLGMPSNTVSRNVQQLEARLGSRLMQRTTRRLTLTAAGEALFARCEQAVAELAQAGQDLMDSNTATTGLIRVGAPANFFDAFSIEWVAQFLAAWPQVRVEFVLSDAKADLVGEGIDLALRAGPPRELAAGSRKLIAQRFSMVASPAYIAARGMPRNLAALAEHDCVGLATQAGPMTWRLDGVADIPVTGRFAANTARAVLQAACAGLGIALLPEVVSAADLQAGRLVQVLPAHRRDAGGLYAVFPSPQHIPRAVSAFVEFAAGKLATMDQNDGIQAAGG